MDERSRRYQEAKKLFLAVFVEYEKAQRRHHTLGPLPPDRQEEEEKTLTAARQGLEEARGRLTAILDETRERSGA